MDGQDARGVSFIRPDSGGNQNPSQNPATPSPDPNQGLNQQSQSQTQGQPHGASFITSDSSASASAGGSTPPSNDSPGLFGRAYTTSGLEGVVDLAKKESLRPIDLYHSAVEKYKSGDWKGATVDALKLTKVLPDLNSPLNQAAMQIILQPFQDVKADYDANRKAGMGVGKSLITPAKGVEKSNQASKEMASGDTSGAVGSGIGAFGEAVKPVPVFGAAVQNITSLMDKDIHDKNWSALAGDVLGPLATLGAGKILGSLGEAGEAAEARIARPLESKVADMPPIEQNSVRPGTVDVAGVKVPVTPLSRAIPPEGAAPGALTGAEKAPLAARAVATTSSVGAGEIQEFIDNVTSPFAKKAINQTLADSANGYIKAIDDARGVQHTPVTMGNPDEVVQALEDSAKPTYKALDKAASTEMQDWVNDKAKWEKANPAPEKPRPGLTPSSTGAPYTPVSRASMEAYKRAYELWQENNDLWDSANPRPKLFTEIQSDIRNARQAMKESFDPKDPNKVRLAKEAYENAVQERDDFIHKHAGTAGVDVNELQAVSKAWKASDRMDFLADRLRNIFKLSTEGKTGLQRLPQDISYDSLRNLPAQFDNVFKPGEFEQLVGKESYDNYKAALEALKNPKLPIGNSAIRELLYAKMGHAGLRVLNPFSFMSNLLFSPDFFDTMQKLAGKVADKGNIVPSTAKIGMVTPQPSKQAQKNIYGTVRDTLGNPNEGNTSSEGASPDSYPLETRLSYARPGPYITKLSNDEEKEFQKWIKDNKIPMEDDGPKTGYDMRGFWKASKQGDPVAKTSINPFDHKIHYSDKWKTPYSTEGFSNESIYSNGNAPHWQHDEKAGWWKLIDKNGKVLKSEGVSDSKNSSIGRTKKAWSGLDADESQINSQESKGFNPIPNIPETSKDKDGYTTYPTITDQVRNLLPPFLRKQTIHLGLSDKNGYLPGTVAHVNNGSDTIQVDRPNLFSPGVAAHEATHVFQDSRNSPYDDVGKLGDDANYDYGGIEGLEKALKKHGTIRQFGAEQQAAIVEDYYRLNEALQAINKHQGYITDKQSEKFERWKAAYEPFIKQLSGMPMRDSDIKNSDLTPDKPKAPDVPPGYISGLSESRLMGDEPMRVKHKK